MHRAWQRLSVRARAALGAAVASVLAFGLAAVWVGDAAYEQWMPAAEARALSDATLLDQAVRQGAVRRGAPLVDGWQQSAYALVLADGSWAGHDRLGASDVAFLPPLPPDVPIGFAETVRVHLPPGVSYDVSTPVGPNPTDRTVTFLRRADSTVSGADLARLTGRQGLPPQRITTYVMVNTVQAKAAGATVTRILGWYLVPGASLFVAAVAWAVTGLALRPVEGIRRGMARIGGGALHERVPVPPSRDGIARLAVTTNATLERLERTVAEQRRLVADASHELRTPVAVLRNSLEVALAHPDGARWPDVVADALADTERLQLLADDLLLLARTDEQQAAGEVDLHDLVAEQVAERRYAAGGPQVRTAALEPATVRGTELLLGRLLRNLLDNAVRYAAGRVTVSLRKVDGLAVLTVADDGPGIAAADRERVFERFVRLDPSRDRADGGAGLGLALVRGIAGALGGTAAAVEPSSGRGAELVIRLPIGTP